MDGLTDDEFFWGPSPMVDGRPACGRVVRAGLGLARAVAGAFHDDRVAGGPHRVRPTHADQPPVRRRLPDRHERAVAGAGPALSWMDGGFNCLPGRRRGLQRRPGRAAEGPPGYIDTRFPLAINVPHVTFELIHHGAEISLLRELYRCGGAGSMATASGNESASNVGE